MEFDGIPEDAVHLACKTARSCNFNDVGLDLIRSKGKWYLIEANMKYGRKGLRMRGMDLKVIMRDKLVSGELTAALVSPPFDKNAFGQVITPV